MKIPKLLFAILLLSSLFLVMNFVKTKGAISVTVHVTNDDNLSFEKGTLTIIETGKTYEIKEAKDFEIQLKKGKYQFKFTSETPHTILFPSKISEKDNWVYINLGKTKLSNDYATDENIKNLVENNSAEFIIFGIVSEDDTNFKEKYGIGVKAENCVITPYLSNLAKENNKTIANYLNKNFGTSWKADLKITPFGLE